MWTLDPEITFLNHGSFGACPAEILRVQAELRERLEREPVRFFLREVDALVDEARGELATFVGADPEDLVFVNNATTGVNTVLRSLDFERGDEVLVTNHAYQACRNAVDYIAEREGTKTVVADVPFPIASEDQVVEAILASVTPRTRLAMIDHITSPTGLVFPIARIVRELDRRGIDTLVDGAHAPGMVPLELRSLGAAYYTGNCHKWLCTPKGSALLWVRRDRQERIRPLVISHGASSKRTDRSRFLIELDYVGTDDPTAFLCVPQAIRHLGSLLSGGWPELMQRNRGLALDARRILCDALGVAPPSPESMIGTLAAVPLPDAPEAITKPYLRPDPLQDALFFEYKIEVPVFHWPAPGKRLVRVAAQLYNRLEHYEKLAAALPKLLRSQRPL
jgi:isopenicillin-N epimerase